MKNTIKYFLYVRKSSESEERQVQSLGDQIDRLTKLAADMGLEIVETLSEAKSAKSPGNRPVFARMLERIEVGEANGILCWEINRLTRNPVDSGKIQWLSQQGVLQSIRTMTREYKPDDNALILSVESGSANQFILDLKRGVRRGLDSKVKKGQAPILAPIGYANTKTETRGENYIIEDDERFGLVRKMWDLMLTGNYSVPQVRDIATHKWALPTTKKKKIGGNPIGYTSAYNMFSNIFYTGQFEYRGVIHPGDHKAMITPAEFDLIQTRLKEHGNPRPKNHEFAYGCGTFRCGECNYSIVGIEKIKYIKRDKETKTYTFYLCGNKGKVISCSQKDNVNEIGLEEQMKAEITKYTIDQEFLCWALDVMKDNDVVEIMTGKEIKESVAKTLETTQEELRKLIQMATKGFISDEEFRESRAELDKTIAGLKAQLKEVESEKNEQLMELTEKAFVFSTYAIIALQSDNKQTKKEVIKSFGLNRTIKDKKLNVVANEWYSEIRKGYFSIKEVLARYEPEIRSELRTINDFPVLRSMMRARWVLTPRPLP